MFLIKKEEEFMNTTLHLKDLHFSHDQNEKELTYSFSFSDAQPIAARGESGAGKTTLLDLIAGFLKPRGGEIFVANKEAEKKPLMPLSYLRQDAPLFDHLSVQKNAAFSRAPSKEISRMAEALGISDLLQKKAGDLSGGQRQRVLLAQTLLQKRSLILLDEPFKGLDQNNKAKAIKVIKKVADVEGNFLIFTTHDPRDVQALGAREIIL
ncbi:MAG TPA: thiamine ABC transporter ATP-binding protein [Holosporales bacterium]|nr:thiamine ABC transporter ATP-binding protein [Holosporales bacterium]